MKYILLFCIIFLAPAMDLLGGGKSLTQSGLAFSSYEVEKENRTSLNLTPSEPFSFPNGFILEFDVSFKKVLHNFGYIVRLTGSGDEYVDLLLNVTQDDRPMPQLTAIYKSGQELCNLTFEELGVDFDSWITVKMVVDPKQQQLKLAIRDTTFEKTDSYFGDLKKLRVVFGKNELMAYETSDVPSMSVKDIYIKGLDEKLLYNWKLSRHAKSGVYDELKQRFASSKAPNWMLDGHAYWRKIDSFTTDVYPQIAFSRKDSRVAIIDSSNFYLYSLPKRSLKISRTEKGNPLGTQSNQLCYNSLLDKFFTYNFTDRVALYDPQARSWSSSLSYTKNPDHWHHNRHFSAVDNALYTWGGYGFHTYKNDIYRYSFHSNTWQRIGYLGDTLSPRYLAGLGVVNDSTVLLFGGYGSEKGDQKLSPHNHCDLYSFNLKTRETKKRWELNAKFLNFVSANSLVVDTLNRCFYALCFPHQKFNSTLKLYRFSMENPSFEILADSIPYSFSDIHSFADLFLSDDGKQLIAVTSYTDVKERKATVSLYSLAFVPLSRESLLQQEHESSNTLAYLMGALLALLLAAAFLLSYRRRLRSGKALELTAVSYEGAKKEESFDPIVGIKPLNEKQRQQSILLFGGFQVYDREGANITGEFTPTLKSLFLLILLYTLKDGKGISSVKLRETLWYDKSEESAKNNRGVSLSKLRVIFEKIGLISINSANSHWAVEFDSAIYCDYYEALILMDRIAAQPEHKDISRLISIVSAGELLPNSQADWADTFKADFSNRLIDLLLHLISQPSGVELSPTAMIGIADTIFIHDSLNEDALKIKCRLLVKTGKNGLAKKAYASFIKEYRALFGADFKYTFEQIIS